MIVSKMGNFCRLGEWLELPGTHIFTHFGQGEIIMKKRTIWTRLLCMTVALAMCLSLVPAAFAAETTEGQVMVETEAGSNEQVDVTITIDAVPNPDGTTTTQTTTEAENFVTENNLVVDYTGTDTTVTDPEGEVIQSSTENEYTVSNPEGTQGAIGGSETTQEQEAPQVEVDVPLTDTDDPDTEEVENQNTETSDLVAGTVTEVTGDVKENEEDGEYDYTTGTVEQPGSTTVTTTDVTITQTIDPENTDLDYISSDTAPDGTNDLIEENLSSAPDQYAPGSDAEPEVPEETVDGYEFLYAGTGNTSQFRPALVFTEPLTAEQKLAQFGDDIRNGAYIHSSYYCKTFVNWLNEEYRNTVAKTEDGQFVTDEEGFILDIYGNRVLKEEKVVVGPDGETYYLHRFDALGSSLNVEGWHQDGEWVKELNSSNKYAVVYATAQQFVLVDQQTGEVVTVYCADISTPTENGFGYHIENLEDADYYTPEQAEQIRSIALNGYWGTTGYETDAEGNTVLDDAGNPVPKLGSLEALKATLLASGEFTAEELESLTDGAALTATQMAIWSCSNHMQGVQFINTHYVGAVGDTETNTAGSGALVNVPGVKEDEAKLMFKLYEFLRGLEPTSYEEDKTTANTVINEQNFLKDLSLTVLDKAEDHVNNQDTDTTNDAYVTNLSFALVVTPSTENGDDLVVSVVDKNGNVLASGRIAGEAQEGENVLTPDAEGNYSFTGITLVEGEQNFNITLEGIQNLAEGVYLYSSEVRTDEDGDDVSSQTMVGVASGRRGVNVSMNIEFDVSVEDDIIIKERVWREEWDKPCDPPENPPQPKPPVNNPSDPPKDNPPEKVPPQVESPETSGEPEVVARATPPKTGDGSLLYSILSALSGMGLSALQLLKKRKKAPVMEEVQAAEEEVPPAEEAPKAQDGARECEPAAAAQESQGEEVTAAQASVQDAADPGSTAVEIPEEVVCVDAGKTAEDALTDRICEEAESEVMAAQPIVSAEDGASGGQTPGIGSAPENGAPECHISLGALWKMLCRAWQLLKEKVLAFLNASHDQKPEPVMLQ